ncbi:MAG: hypothetical protein Ct9H300mP9_2720 [Candidatus Neomarinimicrobiota bacterium]|nr:MAG: hypothetical protein Ct9H300mP9_2720 [Candidatus Neomarinimicrobiota bacterium]
MPEIAVGKRTPLKLFDAKGIGPAAGFSSTVDDPSKFGSWQFRLLNREAMRS